MTAITTPASVHRYNNDCGIRSICHPMTSAAAGNSGRIYDGSFDPDALKKQNTNTIHARQKRSQQKPLFVRGASRQLRIASPRNTPVHGIKPTSSNGTKYQTAPVRRCSVVRKRSTCSWIKKNRANSGFLSDATMNQGAA